MIDIRSAPADAPASPAPRRGNVWPAVVGGVAAGVVFLLLLLNGHLSLLRRDPLGGFYDVQAHSLWHGHLSVPAAAIGFEAIFIHGHAYIYYGPWPSLLRMPLELFTHRFDGRLSQLSMLCAFAVAMIFTARLSNRIRALVRGDAPLTRVDQWATGVFVFVVGAGSVLMFLASVAWVYHEAELWGAALAIAAFDLIVAYCIAPSRRALVLASLLTTLAFLSRGSVGAGPVAALGLLLVASLWAPTRRLAGLTGPAHTRREWRALAVAFAVPTILYVSLNYAKFRTLFTVPTNRQILYTPISAARRAALADNGNSLFGLRFIPTTLLHALRPDAIRITQLFPWVSFPPRADVIGHVRFDTIDVSASLTASMPALAVLAIIGIIGIVRPRATGGPTLAVLRAPVVGALAATSVTLGIAYIAERYLSDFIPLLVLLSAAGLHVALEWGSRAAFPKWAKRAALLVLALLAAFSVWANVGLGVLYQRALAPTTTDEWRIADFVRFQHSVHSHLPGGAMPYVQRGDVLPAPGPLGTLFVLGDCRGLFWSAGDRWRAIERTNDTGNWRFRVSFSDAPGAPRQPLFVTGAPGSGSYIAAKVLPDSRVVFGYLRDGPNAQWLDSPPERIDLSKPHDLDLVYDPLRAQLAIRVDDRLALNAPLFLQPAENPRFGRNDIGGPVSERFAGSMDELPVNPTLCRELTSSG